MSHPDFFSAAKLNGYVPPNKEVMVLLLNLFKNNHGLVDYNLHFSLKQFCIKFQLKLSTRPVCIGMLCILPTYYYWFVGDAGLWTAWVYPC